MRRVLFKYAALATMTLAVSTAAGAEALNVFYTNSAWKSLYDEVARQFETEHPDIKINYQTPVATYEEMEQTILRGRISGQMPDVAFVGLNRVESFANNGLGVSLTPFLSAEPDEVKKGYIPAMLKLAET